MQTFIENPSANSHIQQDPRIARVMRLQQSRGIGPNSSHQNQVQPTTNTTSNEPQNVQHCSTLSSLNDIIKNSKIPIIISFSTSWCHFCDKIEPIFNNLSNEYNGKILFIKVNGDRGKDIVQEYNVTGYPTFISIYNNDIIQRLVGADETQLRSCIQKLLDSVPKLHLLPLKTDHIQLFISIQYDKLRKKIENAQNLPTKETLLNMLQYLQNNDKNNNNNDDYTHQHSKYLESLYTLLDTPDLLMTGLHLFRMYVLTSQGSQEMIEGMFLML